VALISAADLNRGPRARFLALQMLTEADDHDRFIDHIFDEKIRANVMPAEDRHLVQEIAFGAVRHRNTLDSVLDHYIQFAMRRHHVAIRWGLRLAAYQLVYLSRIPPHAAIHGTLEAMKAFRGLVAKDIGFTNAVLRRVHNDIQDKSPDGPENGEDRNAIPARHGWCSFNRPVLPAMGANKKLFMAIKYSHPKWLLSRWIDRFGDEDTLALCQANNRVPRVTAILTGREPSREAVIESLEEAGVEIEEGLVEEAIRMRRPGDIRDLEPFKNGWIRIQDETAKRIGDALEPPVGARVLDVCAGPGGKATQLLEQIGPEGHLVACDVEDWKLDRVRENLGNVGSNFTLIKLPRDPHAVLNGSVEGLFDYILVDVPCSNTGVLARRPEARWRIHPEDFDEITRLQRELLSSAIKKLAPGGRLVYATCSIEPEENGQVVSAIRRRFPDLEEEGSRLFLPQRDGADGGYFAILSAPEEGWAP
jgi:16S rRNA (cytosine967-C5)-methyltransferase